MSGLKRNLYGIVTFLSFIIIFQSCTVYRSNPVSFEEASRQNVKIKAFNTDGQKLKFKRIEKKNDSYFGYVKPNSSTGKILQKKIKEFEKLGSLGVFKLNPNEIKEIYPQNKTVTAVVNIGAAALTLITVLYVIAAAIILSSWGDY